MHCPVAESASSFAHYVSANRTVTPNTKKATLERLQPGAEEVVLLWKKQDMKYLYVCVYIYIYGEKSPHTCKLQKKICSHCPCVQMRMSWRSAWWSWLMTNRSSRHRLPKVHCHPNACASASSSWSAISSLWATAWWRRSTKSAGRCHLAHPFLLLTIRGKLDDALLNQWLVVSSYTTSRYETVSWVVPYWWQ